MRALTSITVVAAGAVIAAALLQHRAGPPSDNSASHGPQAAIETTVSDLGHMAAGSVVAVHLPIANVGRRRLVVRQDGCSGCGDRQTIIVEPGESAWLSAEVRASRSPGQITQSEVFYTNDPELPRLEWQITASISGSPE